MQYKNLFDRSPLRFQITTSSDTISTWIESGIVSPKLREQFTKVDVLLVPRHRYGDAEVWHFPSGTEEFYQFMREQTGRGIHAEVCIEDEDYKELILHSDTLNLPDIIATVVVIPILVNLVSEFIKMKFLSRSEKANVRFRLTITDTKQKRSVNLEYDGKASDFNAVVGQTLNLVDSDKMLEELENTEEMEYEQRILRLKQRRNEHEK